MSKGEFLVSSPVPAAAFTTSVDAASIHPTSQAKSFESPLTLLLPLPLSPPGSPSQQADSDLVPPPSQFWSLSVLACLPVLASLPP